MVNGKKLFWNRSHLTDLNYINITFILYHNILF